MILEILAQLLEPDDREIEVCSSPGCIERPVFIIGEAGEVAVCAADAAGLVQILLQERSVRRELARLMNSTVLDLTW
ncbi:MAG: hypothetical protein ACOY93_08635 [Bacillota bacterium]